MQGIQDSMMYADVQCNEYSEGVGVEQHEHEHDVFGRAYVSQENKSNFFFYRTKC